MKVYAGEFRKIYDPGAAWYINDHTIIRGDDGWHLFGITHEEPADPLNEILCAHAHTPDLLREPFKKLPYPFSAERTAHEMHFWAPHVIRVDGLYYMFYCAGGENGHDQYRLHLATSTDLYHWERHAENPLVIDGFDARDPMVTRIGDEWVMYYTCNSAPAGGSYCVAAVTSKDLVHWGNKRNVFVDKTSGTYGGPCESPFVICRGGKYFLFIGPRGVEHGEYVNTGVFASEDPFAFSEENQVGAIPSHAAEVVCVDGQYYVTHCGWGQGGVYLAPLMIETE